MTQIDWPEIEGANYTAPDEEVQERYEEAAEDHDMAVEELVDDVVFIADMEGTGELTPSLESFTAGEEGDTKDWRLEALRVWENIHSNIR